MARRGAFLGLVGVTFVLLSGCSAPTAPELQLGDLIGRHLGEVPEGLATQGALLVQDASPRVSLEPTFSADQINSSRWTIVAACSGADDLANTERLEIAVIPTASFAEVEADAGWRDSYSDVVVCER